MGGGARTSHTAAGQPTGYPQRNFTPKGAQNRGIYQERIKMFTANGQYSSVNLRSMFDADREDGKDFVELAVYSVPDLARPPFSEVIPIGWFLPHSLTRTHTHSRTPSHTLTHSHPNPHSNTPPLPLSSPPPPPTPPSVSPFSPTRPSLCLTLLPHPPLPHPPLQPSTFP